MSIRHEFYETDDKVTISIFERGADPEKVKVDLTPTSLQFQHGEQSLTLSPLKGEIDPAASTYTVSKIKVEVKLQKKAEGRWGKLVKTTDDDKPGPPTDARPANEPLFESRKQQKNWDKVTTEILGQEKDKTTNEDPNSGGDAALNGFFQQLYAGADEDSRRAMMKSFVESGGTTLSTNWDEVQKANVDVKPPEGSEWKKWGA